MGEGYWASQVIETRSPACCLQTGLLLLNHCFPTCQQGRKPGLGGGRFRSDESTPPCPSQGGHWGGGAVTALPASAPPEPDPRFSVVLRTPLRGEPRWKVFLPLAGCSLASSSWQPRGRAARWRVGGQREAAPRLSHGWYPHPASLPIRPRALALPGRLRGP